MKQSYNHRSKVSFYTRITASLPIIDVDLCMNSKQMRMLIKGFKYVPLCQYRFARKSIDELVTEQHHSLSITIKNCLNDFQISTIDERRRQAFQVLRQLLFECYSKSIPKKLELRAKQEKQIVRSIQRVLMQRSDVVIRRTDKSKVFYIGQAVDFERKAQEYMSKTNAYEEIMNGRCPLKDHLCIVENLLKYFASKNILTIQQRNRLMPSLQTLELGHYHGLPKPHKVIQLSMGLRFII